MSGFLTPLEVEVRRRAQARGCKARDVDASDLAAAGFGAVSEYGLTLIQAAMDIDAGAFMTAREVLAEARLRQRPLFA